MRYEWDEVKREANLPKHGVDFTQAALLEWDSCLTRIDDRFAYGEVRYQTLGLIGDRLHVVVWAEAAAGNTRIISLRKANRREVEDYVVHVRS